MGLSSLRQQTLVLACAPPATQIASWMGEQQLRLQLQQIDPLLAEQLAALQRGEPLASAMAAVTLSGAPSGNNNGSEQGSMAAEMQPGQPAGAMS